jgi:hypothetical protein
MLQGQAATREWWGKVGQSLREDLPGTCRGKTAEAAHPHHEDNATATDRQIGEGTVVVRVNPPGAAVAQGAAGTASLACEGESKGVGGNGDVLDMQRLETREKLLGTHGKPL